MIRAPEMPPTGRHGSPASSIRPNSSRRPLRVLHVINSLGVGGAEALLYRLVAQPTETEHHIICLRSRDWFSPLIEKGGTPLEHLEMAAGPGALAAIRRLGSRVRDLRPDVIQAWMYGANLSAGVWGKMYGVPVVWGIHHSTLETLRWQSRSLVYLGGTLARWVPSMIVNCSSRSAEVHSKVGYKAAPSKVIYNGYDPDEFFPDESSRAVSRKSLGIGEQDFLIGSIGRWHPQKDIPNLLRAVKLVRDRGIAMKCLLIGNNLGPGNAQLEEALAATGTRGPVEPLGRRADVVELARSLDLHVLASADGEAFPNVVAETMLSGTPNVVTDVGDAAMMVGETGWVVPPRQPEQLAAAIEDAYRERSDAPKRWQKRRRDARRRIADSFTLEKMAKAYEAVWREMAAAANRGQSV